MRDLMLLLLATLAALVCTGVLLRNMGKILQLVIDALGRLVRCIILGFLFSTPVWFLWNLLVPDIFGLPQLNWYQAIGLTILSGIIIWSSQEVSK